MLRLPKRGSPGYWRRTEEARKMRRTDPHEDANERAQPWNREAPRWWAMVMDARYVEEAPSP